MTNPLTLYNNPSRKREIVESLKNLETFQLEAANALDKKAWDVLLRKR